MNREIKCRAWDKEKEEMKKVTALGWSVTGHIIDLAFSTPPETEWESCMRYVIMLYTGLKDKNGQEIYEGDIVEWIVQDKQVRGLVIFDDGCFLVEFSFGKAKKRIPLYEYTKQNIKVIGNKFEHTETILLHEKLLE